MGKWGPGASFWDTSAHATVKDTRVVEGTLKTMHMEPTPHSTLRGRPEPPLSEEQFDREFKPKGAIAFFILLVILGLIIWYGIYFLMLARA